MHRDVKSLLFIFFLFILLYTPLYPHSRPLIFILLNMYCVLDYYPVHPRLETYVHHAVTQVLSLEFLYPFRHGAWTKIYLETEWSTIFLSLRGLGVRNQWNDLAFFLTFSYFRMYRLSLLVGEMCLSDNIPPYIMACTSILYALNVYWYGKILAVLCGKKKKNVSIVPVTSIKPFCTGYNFLFDNRSSRLEFSCRC